MVNNGKGTSSVDITRDSFEATELRYANSFQNDDSILTVDPEETERVPVTYSTLKKAMMKKAEDIHQQYQMNQNVSPGKRKSMSLCNEGPTGTKELQEFKISGKVQKKDSCSYYLISFFNRNLFLCSSNEL